MAGALNPRPAGRGRGSVLAHAGMLSADAVPGSDAATLLQDVSDERNISPQDDEINDQ